ncbi:MAG: DNA primase [Candidatus Omnitrophica bacterium]|nr:DNA primase [Candidatus Omnitrophota bacterium]
MGLIPEDSISQVIDRSDIVEVISSYLPLKRSGRNFKATCPFHNEKTASFMVNPDKQIFHCFGCGVGGNVVNFIMKHERMEFPEAVRLLAKRAGIILPEDARPQGGQDSHMRQKIFEVNAEAAQYYHKILLSDISPETSTARDYLKSRGIDLEAVKQFQLGYALNRWDGLLEFLKNKGYTLAFLEKAGLIIPRDNRDGYYDRFRERVMFPIFDTLGHCRAFGGRTLKKNDTAKYLNSPETFVYTKGHHLYGFHLAKQAIAEKDCVIITEGYMDCLIPFQHGVRNIVACLGTALTVDQIRLLRRYTRNIVMLFDMDKAGEAAMLRSLDTLVEEGMQVKIASLTEGEDPDSFVRKFGVKAFEENVVDARPIFDYKLQAMTKLYDVKTVEGKARIVEEMLSTIAKFDNAVIRSGYVSRLSRSLNINEASVMTELNKIKKVSGHPEVKSSAAEKSPSRAVESNILKIILDQQDLIPQMKKEVPLEDFQDQEIRNVISKIFDMYAKEKKINFASLLSSFDDEKMQQMISSLMQEEQVTTGDKEKIYQDCVNRIKKDKKMVLRKEMLEKIREAELAGNHNELDKLKEEFNQLIKQ